MSKYQPFLQPKINLAQFSELINIPTHHLAYFFREIRKKAFNDYVNEYRVEHAKSMITEGKTANLTLEAIGVLSGFSSRTTFFRAFKKVEDVSPGAFADKIY
jgi:YesN/AraC family two-component response regulator